MMIEIEAFRGRLLALDPEAPDFLLQVDGLVSEASAHGVALVPAIFEFFEANPLADVGLPGTLVHFTEQFYPSYKALLLESLRAVPSVPAVLMANRILNSKLGSSEREEYLTALAAAASHTLAPAEVQDQARHFIAYQHGRV